MTKTGRNLEIYRHPELFHHQLRPFSFLSNLNARFVSKFLKRIDVHDRELIVNFAYDYGFLRKLFPQHRIVTILNDNFEAQAKPWMRRRVAEEIASVCRVSDMVLAVSYPLLNMARRYNENCDLLLPWSSQDYARPAPGNRRRVALYFGYVHRVDWAVIEFLLSNGVPVRVVGPFPRMREHWIARRLQYRFPSLLELKGPSHIKELQLDDVCCTLLPYSSSLKNINFVTASNRLFNLLALGLPAIHVDLPYLIDAPREVIWKCKKIEEYLEGYRFAADNFDSLQNKIQEFVAPHNEDSRRTQLEGVLQI